MSYLDQTTRPDPRTLIAVAALHGAMGLALVTGLTVSGVLDKQPPPLTGETIHVPLPPPPPPPEPPEPAAQVDPPASSQVYVPTPPLPLPPLPGPTLDSTSEIRDNNPVVPTPMPQSTGTGTATTPVVLPQPTPQATLPATKPVPRGNPGEWITDADYRSRWVNEELTGTARFRLDIGTGGRVTDCRVTRSTGHAALDTATCTLIQRRARFTPSRDSAGNTVPGTYEGSIVWRLPE